ncbi:MAG: hypothetical protein ACKPKO_26170, partial [Candidatus Fonsibacter sp.]
MNLTAIDNHAMLRHVSDVLQGFRARVQHNLRYDSVLLLKHIEYGRFVVVGKIELEFGVGRWEIVLGILELQYSAHYRLIFVLIGVLLAN